MSDHITRCGVCKCLVDEEDLFCANCGTECPVAGEARPDGTRATNQASRLATHNFECAGCGASMSYDASKGALRCPFCASLKLVQKPDARVLAPEAVVPFRVEQPRALEAMHAWLRRGWFRPGDLVARAAVVRMQPVYVPCWVFEAWTHTHWTADSSQTPFGARGDWFPLAGEHQGRYAGVVVGASGALTPEETRLLGRFELSEGRPPDEVDLDNVTVEQFSVPRKFARPLARSSIEQAEASRVAGEYVPGRARNVHVNVKLEAMASRPVLLPVWIMAYRYRDRVFRLLVNGQTGQVTGSAPTSWLRVTAAIGFALLVFLLILLLAGLFGGVVHGAQAASGASAEPAFCYTYSTPVHYAGAWVLCRPLRTGLFGEIDGHYGSCSDYRQEHRRAG